MRHPIFIDSEGKINRKSVIGGLINKYLSSPAGRQKLAQSMAQPLRTRLDYSSIGRKALVIEQMPPASLAFYEKDVYKKPYKHRDIIINSKGKIGKRYSGVRVQVPTFQVYANPTVKLSDIKMRRFDLISRAKSEIMEQEDSAIFNALDQMAKEGF